MVIQSRHITFSKDYNERRRVASRPGEQFSSAISWEDRLPIQTMKRSYRCPKMSLMPVWVIAP